MTSRCPRPASLVSGNSWIEVGMHGGTMQMMTGSCLNERTAACWEGPS